jgi:Na+/citrate or Na+/malate symporter
MSEVNERGQPSPTHGRWQFSLRRMFVATTAVAVIFGLAAWKRLAQTDLPVYVSLVVVLAVFWRPARQALTGACVLLIPLGITGLLGEITDSGPTMIVLLFQPPALWISILLVFYGAAYLRANLYATAWSLIGSVVLIELFIAMAIACSCHYYRVYQLVGFQNRDGVYREWLLRQFFLNRFPGQLWYIVTPWLLGIVVGEIVARRRKPSGSDRQRV